MNYTPIFVIQYSTNVRTEQIPCSVWTLDLGMANKFVNQHNFDPSCLKRFVINQEDVEGHTDIIQSDNELEVFKLKSNVDNQIHQVVTTEEIINSIVQYVGDDLVDNLMFGDIIGRCDIKIVDRICDIIEELDYASIADWELISDDIVDRYYDEDYFYGDSINEHPEIPPPTDTSAIYDALWSDRINGEYLPFTLEAYVHYFVKDILGG